MQLLVITGHNESLGFRCAGIECREVGDGSDISNLLLTLQAEGKYGLIAVEDRYLSRVSENVMRRMIKKGLPIILPINIPQKWGEVEVGESPVVKLIRRAIGYQIKIKR